MSANFSIRRAVLKKRCSSLLKTEYAVDRRHLLFVIKTISAHSFFFLIFFPYSFFMMEWKLEWCSRGILFSSNSNHNMEIFASRDEATLWATMSVGRSHSVATRHKRGVSTNHFYTILQWDKLIRQLFAKNGAFIYMRRLSNGFS